MGWRCDGFGSHDQPDQLQLVSKDRIIEKEDTDEKQFAFEGVEKGDIVEYYYVIKDSPDFSGVEYFQRKIPLLEGKFQLNNLGNDGKIYIGAYNGMKNESTKKINIYTVSDLPAYIEEPNAANLANLAKVITLSTRMPFSISPRMVLYLYKDVLDYLKVQYQFMATTDKFEDRFDSEKVVPARFRKL